MCLLRLVRGHQLTRRLIALEPETVLPSLTIDAGWREVAQKALEFVKRFT